jgi:hypothetical protein
MNTHLRRYPMLLSCCSVACLLAAGATTRTESLGGSQQPNDRPTPQSGQDKGKDQGQGGQPSRPA